MKNDDMKTEWVPCPSCGGHTRTKIRKDTKLYHHLVFCPKCKKEYLVNVTEFTVTVVNEPDVHIQRELTELTARDAS